MKNLEKLFNPQTIAIIGASDKEGKVGTVITKNILELGYQGKVFLINPSSQEIFGHKVFSSVNDIPESELDLAIIVIPAKFVNDAVRQAATKIKNFVIISAGFSEIGEEGKAREEELKQIAAEFGLNILGPNCLGFIIPGLKLNASFAKGMPKKGKFAFISQSGALISAIMDLAEKEDIRFSNIISIGNEAVVDEFELLNYLKADRQTKVIGMYLEGLKEGQKFSEIASEISAKKPIVILKAGKTEKAQKAISSHTGALAGSDETISALFRKSGVIRAESFENFINLCKLISLSKAPKNEKVIAITNAGGAGVLTTDAFKNKKVQLAEISEAMKTELKTFLPAESSVANPIDLLGDAQEDRYLKTLEVLEREDADTIVCILTPQQQTRIKEISEAIIEFKKKSKKNIFAVFVGGKRISKIIPALSRSKIMAFAYPETAIECLDQHYDWSLFKKSAGKKTESKYSKEINDILESAQKEGRKALFFNEGKKIFEYLEIPVIDSVEIMSKEDLQKVSAFPAVLKIDSPNVLHKTDKNALALDIKNSEELAQAFEKINSDFPGERMISQPMLERQTEIILGIKKDPTVGPVVVFGLGGIYTEIFRKIELVIPPVSKDEIKERLASSSIGFLFKNTRGQASYNIDEIADIIEKISVLAQTSEKISELDVNPLLIYNNGTGAKAVDIKIIF